MAKFLHSDAIDNGPQYVKTNGNKMVACTAQPTTYAEANATFKLAEVTMASGDYTLANGDTSGRKITVAPKTGIAVLTTGTATHVAIIDTVNSKLLMVTTCASQALGAGGTVDIGTWKNEIAAPV